MAENNRGNSMNTYLMIPRVFSDFTARYVLAKRDENTQFFRGTIQPLP